jgi:alpha-amylase/alpha-mannosidase (GH57 family)
MSGDAPGSAAARLKVVLCWHMHQPQYRDQISGRYALPWTYLHGIKDYVDMAAHLEAVPEARAVINFAPVLLEQLEDYAGQIGGYLGNGVALRDPLLAALIQPVLPSGAEERAILVMACLRANDQHMIRRFPAYARLAALAREALEWPDMLRYLDEMFFSDLIVWYHLAWLGETVRRGDARAKQLVERGEHFTLHERRALLALLGELLAGIVPRYRALAGRGQIELSVTPYAHPILPLLLDFAAARAALPEAPLPQLEHYPDGEARARWHVREGLATFERHFGFRPTGCWPSEGGVSEAALRLLGEAGFRWTASGEAVLANSLRHGGHAPHAMKEAWLYRPYRAGDSKVGCFFRDDGLSDLIGFTYASWHADDAVANLVEHLETIAERCAGHDDRVVSIILDGENAWEYYPENGYYFLDALYRRLAAHPRLELTTFSDYLRQHSPQSLQTLTPGSWVYGTFSTWIGDRDKNRGWDMLGEVKQLFDQVAPLLPPERRAAAERQLAICEGSDWFWWFGDYNPEATVSDFEQLFRRHLTNLYQLLHHEPPEYLARSFTRGSGTPVHGGTMRPGQES